MNAPPGCSLEPLKAEEVYWDWGEIPIRYGDQDPNRHVNNVAVCQYMEEARVGMRARCFSEAALATAAGFVVVSLRVRFLCPLAHPGSVRAGNIVTRIGRTSFTLVHGLFARGTIAALGRTVTVVCDSATGQPIQIPTSIAESLAALQAESDAVIAAADAI